MPTYDYRCSKCGTFETYQRISEPPLDCCPTCQGAVKRLIGRNVGIIFKGPGFYCTDNRTKSHGDKDRDSEGKAESTPKAEDKKTESTPKAEDKKAETA
ncbi:MAG: FmdB family zinc ribbon protein [Bacillota bacterium]